MYSLISLLLLTSPLLASAELVPAIPVLPRSNSLQTRDTSNGWSLSASICPANTQACAGEDLAGSCCPTGTQCFGIGLSDGVACCPNENDCSSAVVAAQACANSTWTLFASDISNAFFCCEPGEVGSFQTAKLIDHGGICLPMGTHVDAANSATLVSSGAAATSAARSTTGASSASASVTSSSASAAATTSNAADTPHALGGSAMIGMVAGVVGLIL